VPAIFSSRSAVMEDDSPSTHARAQIDIHARAGAVKNLLSNVYIVERRGRWGVRRGVVGNGEITQTSGEEQQQQQQPATAAAMALSPPRHR